MSKLYLPNELVDLIYKQSLWLLIGDKMVTFKDIHQTIKKRDFWKVYKPKPRDTNIKICFEHPRKELMWFHTNDIFIGPSGLFASNKTN